MKNKKRNVHRIVAFIVSVITIACGCVLFIYSRGQTSRIKQMLNEAAYDNVENILTNLEKAIVSEFEHDYAEAKILASSCANSSNIENYIQTSEEFSDISDVYYGNRDDQIAIGKNGKELNLENISFKEKSNGSSRSAAYMDNIGDFSYLIRVPVKQENNLEGYLYIKYSMERFEKLMPRDEKVEGSNYSIMAADSMRYVYTPSGSVAGSHINFGRLQDYLQNQDDKEAVLSGVQQALQEKYYYIKAVTLKNIYDTSKASEYVLFLWPIDDGEYYISGFARMESLQAERIDVEKTIQTLFTLLAAFSGVILLLIAISLGRSSYSAQKRAEEQKKHNQELNEALQIAKIANESKSNFLSNMSHDIRTPMNAIIGFTTLFLKETKEETARSFANKILNAGNYLLSLINDILDMSKIESGKTTLSITEFGITQLCENAKALIQIQANENHQIFTTKIENISQNQVYGDELRVHQILMNILSNAVKYTPTGGKIEFLIRGIPCTKMGHQKVQFQVTDTGYGIAEENLTTIFEPFSRANDARTNRIQGTGLGLAIVKNLVDLMGGTIRVESELEKGSCFTVELAFAVADKEAQTSADTKTVDKPEEISLNGMHILAAEDNELNAEILKELLQMEGVECKICEDGKKVLEEFETSEKGTYDVILMDIQMPVMNGYEATKAIRCSAHPEAKSIPIIAMTANAFSEDVQNALNSGMNAHVAKPLDMNVLKTTIIKERKRGQGK